MGRYDWSVESDASVVSQSNTTATLRVNCYFRNNNWDYSMYMTGYVSCNDGGMVTFPRKNIDTRPSGKNGRTFIGSHDYIIQKSRGGHNVRYSARVMSDSGYANGDKWSAEHSAWIPSLASYKITYNANGGTGAPGEQTRWYGQSDFHISNTVPSRTGYLFKGWSGSNGTTYNPGDHYGGDANLTLTAIWQNNSYTVTFRSGYGDNAVLKTQTVNHGESATPPANPTRDGYDFSGWDGSYTNVTSNRTVTAKWTPKKYTITYNAMGGSSAPPQQTKTHGQNAQISTSVPTMSGHRFKGWATSPTGEVSYTSGSTYSSNSSITLYAVWEAIFDMEINIPDGTSIDDVYINLPDGVTIDDVYINIPDGTKIE